MQSDGSNFIEKKYDRRENETLLKRESILSGGN